jgi:hypothetical protein
MMHLETPPAPPIPRPPLREWYCRHCQKLLGRFDWATLRGEIRCPRCRVDNRRGLGV